MVRPRARSFNDMDDVAGRRVYDNALLVHHRKGIGRAVRYGGKNEISRQGLANSDFLTDHDRVTGHCLLLDESDDILAQAAQLAQP